MNRTRALAVTIAAVAVVLLGAAPAFAHTAHVFGEVKCDVQTGRQVVTWFNQGGSKSFGPTTITSSSRASIAVGQVIPAETIVKVGTETFPNDATGTITAKESWLWGDGFTHNSHGSVTLGIDCTQPTSPTPTPTTSPPTSTTPPPTSSSSSSSSSSTPPSGTGSSTSSTSSTTGPPSATSGSTSPGGTPFTGMSSTPLIALGAFVVLGLGALALSRKKVDEV